MYDTLQNSSFGRMPLWKKAGIIIGGILIVSVVITILKMMLFGYGARTMSTNILSSDDISMGAPSMQMEEMAYDGGGMMKSATDRSMPPITPSPDYGATGGDAEAYESLRYDARIKGKEIESTCDAIEELKPLQYVVFESAQRRDGYCSYSFKVERSYAETIVEEIDKLNPYDFTAHTQTRKNQVTRFEGRLDILLQQEEMYRAQLENANSEYDRAISTTADIPDAQALAQLIRDRQDIVARINRERLNLASQLQNLSQSSAEVTDSIEYVDFLVSVHKYEIVNVQNIKDSWMTALGSLVENANNTLQYLTVGIVQLALFLVLVLVYAAVVFFFVLFMVRSGATVVRYVWKRKEVTHEHPEHHE